MNNNELIRPLLRTTVAEELHPSYGLGRPYSQDFCQSVMFMHLNTPDELLSPHIIEQQQAKTFPSKRTNQSLDPPLKSAWALLSISKDWE